MENSLCKDRLSTLLFLKWHSKTAGDSDRGKSLGGCDKPQMAPSLYWKHSGKLSLVGVMPRERE